MKKTNVSEEEATESLDLIEGICDYPYDEYKNSLKSFALSRHFINLGILKRRLHSRAIEIHKKLSETHRKEDRSVSEGVLEKEKIDEISKNKKTFLDKYGLPQDEQVFIKRIITTDDGNVLTIGIPHQEKDKQLLGGATNIYKYMTPNLYKRTLEKLKIYSY